MHKSDLFPYEYLQDRFHKAIAYHVVDNWYIISLRNLLRTDHIGEDGARVNFHAIIQQKTKVEKKVEHLFCIPYDLLNNSQFTKQMDNFVNQFVHNKRHIFFYGSNETVFQKKINKIGEFQSYIHSNNSNNNKIITIII